MEDTTATGRTYLEALAHENRNRRPANPGECYKLRLYPHYETGEILRGYSKQAHTLLYVDKQGNRVPYTETEDPNVLSAFYASARKADYRLVTRPERRRMWKEERKRYKRILAARKAAEG
jgi:hypothetical protein